MFGKPVLLSTAFVLSTFGAHALEANDFVYVCQDAGAGAYEAFPDVCRMADGRLMSVFYAGWEHVSLPRPENPNGGRVSVCYSSDEGNTWTPAETLYDGPNDVRDPSITQLKSGALLCTYFSLKPKEGGGHEGLGSYLLTSTDAGKTWSEPQQISDSYYVSAPVRELSDGTLILGLYREVGNTANGAVTRSNDGGKTWSSPIDIDNGGVRLDAETDIIELKDGRLYAAQRTDRHGNMRYSISQDKGLTWTVSPEMPFPGHAPYLYRSPEDAIVVAHRLPQTSLHISRDECATWGDGVMVDDVSGSYPSMVTLKDGSTLIVYYEEGKGSSIRARKFRVKDQGVEWLKF